jgi:hypothetical protein
MRSGIVVGTCACGCGKATPLAPRNDKRRGQLKGQPIAYVHGHNRARVLVDKFWDNVQRDAGECWNWTGWENGSGYGKIWHRGRALYAHRVSLELAGIEIPTGSEVLHSCDNPRCVNPAHLRLGSHLDNMRDMASKGRGRKAVAHGAV